MSRGTGIVTVACRRCLAINSVQIGTSFYDADALYECGKCGNTWHVHLRQTPAPYAKPDFYQKGKVK